MWRTGKTKVALDRLPEIADLMKVDLGLLMPMWFEQQLGEAGADRVEQETKLKAIAKIFNRLVTMHEMAVVKGIRKVFGKTDPAFTGEQIEAMTLVAFDEAFALKVIELAAAEGVTLPSAA
jgi:DNA-binding cell septation regulator SpoVG